MRILKNSCIRVHGLRYLPFVHVSIYVEVYIQIMMALNEQSLDSQMPLITCRPYSTRMDDDDDVVSITNSASLLFSPITYGFLRFSLYKRRI